MARTERFRLRFPFWLDLNKPDERELSEKIELLKNERSFAATVRNGLRLMLDLREGNTTVLYELFPQLRNQLGRAGGDSGDDELKRELKRLQELILNHPGIPAPPGDYPVMKPLTAQRFELPTFDDDDDLVTVVAKKVDGQQIAENFLNGLSSLGIQQ